MAAKPMYPCDYCLTRIGLQGEASCRYQDYVDRDLNTFHWNYAEMALAWRRYLTAADALNDFENDPDIECECSEWRPQHHQLLGDGKKKIVRTCLTMASAKKDGDVAYPDAQWCRLPFELLEEVFSNVI